VTVNITLRRIFVDWTRWIFTNKYKVTTTLQGPPRRSGI